MDKKNQEIWKDYSFNLYNLKVMNQMKSIIIWNQESLRNMSRYDLYQLNCNRRKVTKMKKNDYYSMDKKEVGSGDIKLNLYKI